MTKICPNCGSTIDDTLSICNNCGFALETKKENSVNDIVEAVTTPIEEDRSNLPSLESAFDSLNIIDDYTPMNQSETSVINQGNTVNEVIIEQNSNPLLDVSIVNEPVNESIPEVQVETQIDQPVNIVEEVSVPQVEISQEEVTPVVSEVQSIEEVPAVTEQINESIPEVQVETQIEQPINIVEEVSVPQVEISQEEVTPVVSEVQSIEEVPVVTEQINESIPEVQAETQIYQPVNVVEVSSPQTEDSSVISEEKTITEEPIVNESIQEVIPEGTVETPSEQVITNSVEDIPTAVLDANTVIDVPVGIEEVSINDIVNNDLENVSIQVEEEIPQIETPIEKVVLPESTIGEIDTNILTSMYEQEEKRNEANKELLAKEEEDRKRREEEARIAQQKAEPKPDLMAKVNYVVSNDNSIDTVEKNKKKKSILTKLIILLLLILIGAGVYWFFFINKNGSKEDTYETPIHNYYKYIEKKDKTGIITSYVSCAQNNSDVISNVDTILSAYKQYDNYKIEYKINSVESVSEEEQTSIKDASLGTYCGIDNVPEIKDYKHLYVSQTLITEERTTKDVEFWVVQIDNKWFIVPTS